MVTVTEKDTAMEKAISIKFIQISKERNTSFALFFIC